MTFAALLADARKRRSQEEAADAIGVHRNTIFRWERGDAIPDAGQLARLAAFYGLTDEERIALMSAAGDASEQRRAAHGGAE